MPLPRPVSDELVELIASPRQRVVLSEVRLHGQKEQRGSDRPGDDEGHEAEQQVGASLARDPPVDADRPREVAEPRTTGVRSARRRVRTLDRRAR